MAASLALIFSSDASISSSMRLRRAASLFYLMASETFS